MTPPVESFIPSIPLSAVVLTHNSDRTLVHVLNSLQFCNEIIVVDSGSTDTSLAIAERFECKIFKRELNGFGAQKDFGVQQATNDWIFVVDSDEIVSKSLRTEIGNVFKSTTPLAPAYSVPIQLYFLGNPIFYSGQQSKKAVRLFNRNHARFDEALVHESVIVDGNAVALQFPLLHHSYLTLEDYFVKFNRYTTLGAQALAERPRRNKKHKVLTSFMCQFIKFYFLKRGFLDGYHGFLWCLLSSFYPVVKYAKYEELTLEEAGSLYPATQSELA